MDTQLEMDEEAPVVITRTGNTSEASVIKSLLEGYGIPCECLSDLPQQIYPLSGAGLAEIRIFVPASLAPEAQRVLKDHRRHRSHLHLVEA